MLSLRGGAAETALAFLCTSSVAFGAVLSWVVSTAALEQQRECPQLQSLA
eukprot:gene16765-biopygen15848